MIEFTKMQGIGNDFVVIDGLSSDVSRIDFSLAATQLCQRRYGVGADGLLVVDRGAIAPIRKRMWNPDGSNGEMCGNGIRCVAKLAADRGYAGPGPFDCEVGDSIVTLEVRANGMVEVDMGPGSFDGGLVGLTDGSQKWVERPLDVAGRSIVGTAVWTGNPHFVVPALDLDVIELAELGRAIENHPLFEHRTNVHFVQRIDSGTVVQKTWERGAGATLACGTGACATAFVGSQCGWLDREVEVRLPGGSLWIAIDESGGIRMNGAAEYVFSGSVELKLPVG